MYNENEREEMAERKEKISKQTRDNGTPRKPMKKQTATGAQRGSKGSLAPSDQIEIRQSQDYSKKRYPGEIAPKEEIVQTQKPDFKNRRY